MARDMVRLGGVVGVLCGLLVGPAWGAERPPDSKVEILAPAADQVLSGTVGLRVKITPPEGKPMPSVVFAGIGGPPWVAMRRVGQTGEWAGELESTMVPNGAGRLVVGTDEKRAKAAVDVRVENPLKCFFGDLHSHTSYSDGTLLPRVAHEYAREVAKLDVFSLTDHLERVDDAEWLDTREQAWDANEDGAFVAIPGLEWSKKQGHACVFDPKRRRWPGDTAAFYRAAAEAGVVVKFNHPGDGSKVFDGLAYSEVGDRAVQMMEVRRGEEEQALLRALKLGWHLAPDGSDDTHSPNWGNCRSWTGILMPGLSKRNVLAALEGRHCFSTLDRNCTLLFTLNGAAMGTILPGPVKEVRVEVSVEDADAEDTIAKIELFADGTVAETDEPKASKRRWTTVCPAEPGEHYYFVKVTQADGNLLWSAPVWVRVGGN